MLGGYCERHRGTACPSQGCENPAVDIGLDTVPVLEQRTREAMAKDRIVSFAPVVGLTGESFDRRVLQTHARVHTVNLLGTKASRR